MHHARQGRMRGRHHPLIPQLSHNFPTTSCAFSASSAFKTLPLQDMSYPPIFRKETFSWQKSK